MTSIFDKNLDEYTFGGTAPERMNHLSALILKHSHRLKVIQRAYEDQFEKTTAILSNSSELSSVRGLTSMTKKYKNVILEGLEHVYSECDTMLTLTNQKKRRYVLIT